MLDRIDRWVGNILMLLLDFIPYPEPKPRDLYGWRPSMDQEGNPR